MSEAIRVLVADSSPLLAEALAEGLAAAALPVRVVGCTSCPAAVRELAARTGADLALVDLALASEVTDALGDLPLPVLLLARDADVPLLLEPLEDGAAGVVLRDCRLADLAAQLQTAARGEVSVPGRLFGPLLQGLVVRRREDRSRRSLLDRLSPRELEVLSRLVAGDDQSGIAAALVISPQTARTHISHVLNKLGVHSRLEAVDVAVRAGLTGPSDVRGAAR